MKDIISDLGSLCASNKKYSLEKYTVKIAYIFPGFRISLMHSLLMPLNNGPLI